MSDYGIKYWYLNAAGEVVGDNPNLELEHDYELKVGYNRDSKAILFSGGNVKVPVISIHNLLYFITQKYSRAEHELPFYPLVEAENISLLENFSFNGVDVPDIDMLGKKEFECPTIMSLEAINCPIEYKKLVEIARFRIGDVDRKVNSGAIIDPNAVFEFTVQNEVTPKVNREAINVTAAPRSFLQLQYSGQWMFFLNDLDGQFITGSRQKIENIVNFDPVFDTYLASRKLKIEWPGCATHSDNTKLAENNAPAFGLPNFLPDAGEGEVKITFRRDDKKSGIMFKDKNEFRYLIYYFGQGTRNYELTLTIKQKDNGYNLFWEGNVTETDVKKRKDKSVELDAEINLEPIFCESGKLKNKIVETLLEQIADGMQLKHRSLQTNEFLEKLKNVEGIPSIEMDEKLTGKKPDKNKPFTQQLKSLHTIKRTIKNWNEPLTPELLESGNTYRLQICPIKPGEIPKIPETHSRIYYSTPSDKPTFFQIGTTGKALTFTCFVKKKIQHGESLDKLYVIYFKGSKHDSDGKTFDELRSFIEVSAIALLVKKDEHTPKIRTEKREVIKSKINSSIPEVIEENFYNRKAAAPVDNIAKMKAAEQKLAPESAKPIAPKSKAVPNFQPAKTNAAETKNSRLTDLMAKKNQIVLKINDITSGLWKKLPSRNALIYTACSFVGVGILTSGLLARTNRSVVDNNPIKTEDLVETPKKSVANSSNIIAVDFTKNTVAPAPKITVASPSLVETPSIPQADEISSKPITIETLEPSVEETPLENKQSADMVQSPTPPHTTQQTPPPEETNRTIETKSAEKLIATNFTSNVKMAQTRAELLKKLFNKENDPNQIKHQRH